MIDPKQVRSMVKMEHDNDVIDRIGTIHIENENEL